MLCQKCQRMFTGQRIFASAAEGQLMSELVMGTTDDAKFRHHVNLNTLERSAATGCHVCVLMMGCLTRDEIEILRPPVERPSELYKILFEIKEQLNSRYWLRFFFVHPTGQSSSGLNAMSSQSSTVRCIEKHLDLYPMSKNYVAGSEWGDSTRSQQSWTCVHKWLETCIQSHKSCSSQPSVASWKPTRLLDLGPMGAKLLPRLIEHEEIPAGVVYATLSHCWGSAKVFKLQKGSISTAKNQVSFRHLSKTFQDAVEACRRMKIRYLWIDSLCIIQDSSEDWDAEASRMEYVYNHCVINIAASHALDGGWGLHTDRDPLILQPCPLTVTWDDGKPMDMLCADLDDWIKRFDSEPLSTRGWVVQERLLSPRICHFSGTQIIWECNEAFASESFPLGFTSNDHKFNIRNLRGLTSLTTSSEDHLKWDCWRDVIRHYSSAGLSFERDKLVAISGIIRRMRDVFQTEYLAGLWWKGIEYQLLWAVHREGKNMPTRSSVFIAPTWSWASLNGAEIDLYSHTNTQTTPSLYRGRYLLCRAIDAQVVPASSTTICTDGHIHMQCFLVPAFITPSTFGWYDIAVPIHEKRLGRQPLISLFTIIDVHMTNRGELNFWLMPILDGLEDKHLEGLLLYSNNHEEGIFRRYGSFRLRGVIDLDNLWKSVFEFEASALEARHSNIGLYDKVWKYQIGSKKEEKYEKCDAVPQFLITIK